WSRQSGNRDNLATIRRAFHTLKGSGRMVGATTVGDFGWALEHLLNQCLEGSLEASPPVVGAVNEAVDLLPDLIETFRAGRPADPRVAALIDKTVTIAQESDATGSEPDTVAREPEAVAGEPDAGTREPGGG